MNDLLLGLGASLGLAGVAVGVLFLIYRQLLSLRIFPRLSQTQGFVLLLFTAVAVFAIAAMAIWLTWLKPDRGGGRKLAGDYVCRTDERPSFPCSIDPNETGHPQLHFAGDGSGQGLVDAYAGRVDAQDGTLRVALLNTFDADPNDGQPAQLVASKLTLRKSGEGQFKGVWQFNSGASRAFSMERTR